MGMFTTIRDAIFGPATHASPTTTARPASGASGDQPLLEPLDQVDIENSLDSLPGADRLNWRTSIVDLMKLIGVECDYNSRRALADELGRPEYAGSAEDDVWLHQRTMRELARNGGRVPRQFLD